MKRIIVKNLAGIQTHGAEMIDPTDWIAEQVNSNSWGLPEREKSELECTPEEIASSLSSREEQQDDSTIVKFYTLPAEYSVITTDITAEENTKLLDVYTAQKIADADVQVTQIVGGITDRRAIATALFHLGVVVNPLGNFTQAQIDASKLEVGKYFAIMAQINSLFEQRDADIEAYKVSLGL